MDKRWIKFYIAILYIILFFPVMLEIGLLKYIIQLIGFILTGKNIYKIRNKFNSIF